VALIRCPPPPHCPAAGAPRLRALFLAPYPTHTMSAFSTLRRRLRASLALVALWGVLLLAALLPAALPAHADSLNTRSTPGYQLLSEELSALHAEAQTLSEGQRQRLEDLSLLEAAVADANDRATVFNNSSHNLGLFARSKKESVDQPARFYVLGPGHETDDDFEAVAVYLPAGVTLSWQGGQPVAGSALERVVRLLPGEALEVSDGDSGPGSETATNSFGIRFELSLPAFALETQAVDLAALPGLSQQQLDAELETAPLD